MDTVFERALEIAKRKGLSQSDLAERLGLAPQNITNWKLRGMPASQYVPVADILDCSLDELLQRDRFIPARSFTPWPFTAINEKKLRSLPTKQALRLEGAILTAAGMLGIDLAQAHNQQEKGVDHG